MPVVDGGELRAVGAGSGTVGNDVIIGGGHSRCAAIVGEGAANIGSLGDISGTIGRGTGWRNGRSNSGIRRCCWTSAG